MQYNKHSTHFKLKTISHGRDEELST